MVGIYEMYDINNYGDKEVFSVGTIDSLTERVLEWNKESQYADQSEVDEWVKAGGFKFTTNWENPFGMSIRHLTDITMHEIEVAHRNEANTRIKESKEDQFGFMSIVLNLAVNGMSEKEMQENAKEELKDQEYYLVKDIIRSENPFIFTETMDKSEAKDYGLVE